MLAAGWQREGGATETTIQSRGGTLKARVKAEGRGGTHSSSHAMPSKNPDGGDRETPEWTPSVVKDHIKGTDIMMKARQDAAKERLMVQTQSQFPRDARRVRESNSDEVLAWHDLPGKYAPSSLPFLSLSSGTRTVSKYPVDALSTRMAIAAVPIVCSGAGKAPAKVIAERGLFEVMAIDLEQACNGVIASPVHKREQ
ncbi:hypothetical protein K438DRAFT_1780750 [Mycena galopus ATCC 62051]|nr:hypothetical protein K438DRAFT_1780750 [Mycena galopus ATCC 62051]